MPTPPRTLTWKGETRSLQEWSRLTRIPAETIRSRIDRQGYTVADALGTPVRGKFRPKGKPAAANTPRPCPALREHPTGQAYCRWKRGGKDHFRYFGPWNSDEAAAGYRRFQMEWAAGSAEPKPAGGLVVAELVDRYLDHVRSYYVKDGRPTSEQHGQLAAMTVLTELYGPTPVAEFRPQDLRVCREAMLARDWARLTINQACWRVKRCFRWGVGQDLVPPDVAAKLEHVENLRPGRSKARDPEPRRSVPPTTVEATIPHLHPLAGRRRVLEGMVRVQLLTGMRPDELCRMTAGSVDRSGEVWCYRDPKHKNVHRQARRKARAVWIGPQAQAVLAPFLAGLGPEDRVWVFPPVGKGTRRTAVSRDQYGRYVARACTRAKVTPWTPHQLRHTRATEVERIYESDEAAGAAIGDTPRVASEVYVDPSDAVARRIARATG